MVVRVIDTDRHSVVVLPSSLELFPTVCSSSWSLQTDGWWI